MTNRALDVLYGTVLFAAAAALYWVSFDPQVAGRPIARDPEWFPRLLLTLMLIASVALAGLALARRATTLVHPVRWRALAITVAAAGMYLAGFYELGFVPATVVLIPAMCWLLGFRRPLVIAAVAVGFTIGVWYCFALLLNVVPPGPGLPTLD